MPHSVLSIARLIQNETGERHDVDKTWREKMQFVKENAHNGNGANLILYLTEIRLLAAKQYPFAAECKTRIAHT